MMTNSVLIIDYGMGNLRSVLNAFKSINCDVKISNNPKELKSAQRIILPGVGAFALGMKNLDRNGWINTLNEEIIIKKKPFLGLCLGMQLLATEGFEHGKHKGLNWINGTCIRIPSKENKIRIPHIGWNDVSFVTSSKLYLGLGQEQTFYFVHSYFLMLDNESIATGICNYGVDFVASIEMENIFATQFHPEKSQVAGIAVLKNFLDATK